MIYTLQIGLQMLYYTNLSKKTYNKLQKSLWAISSLIFITQILFPRTILAQSPVAYMSQTMQEQSIASLVKKKTVLVQARRGMAMDQENHTSKYEVVMSGRVLTTAYSSTIDQTDSTPFITSNGTRVYDGLIAANFLPYNTKVRFPKYFGDKIFTVNDRMHPRYNHRIDIWMPTRAQALQFGVHYLEFEIIEDVPKLNENYSNATTLPPRIISGE